MNTTIVCGTLTASAQGTTAATLPMYLIVVSGDIPGAMLRLPADGLRLGRASDNSYQFHEISISRYHAVFGVDEAAAVWLTDQGSTNGTFLNGRRLTPHLPARVKDGDRIQLGSVITLKFVRLDPYDEQFQREMFERTVRDALTNLYNRAYFLNQVDTLAELSAARGLGLAILMLDIDHFKRINDTYGHDVGDAVLREVAGVLRESTRPEDLVARYGGEEFVAALTVAAPDQANERAERIRANLAARRISAGGTRLRVTASLGLAFAPIGHVPSVASLITAADRCLYQAKRTGRNRVVFRLDLSDVDPSTLSVIEPSMRGS